MDSLSGTLAQVLDERTWDYLRSRCEAKDYEDGAAIVRAGERGSAFYLIESGAVDIQLADDDGHRLRLTRLEAGESFGEMSLITGDPVSADVIAHGPTQLLELPGALFDQALADCDTLRFMIFRRLSRSLRTSNDSMWRLFQRMTALTRLADRNQDLDPVIASAGPMKRLEADLGKHGATVAPVLITGAPGTGKAFFCRHLHARSERSAEPLIEADCRTFDEGEACNLLFGTSDPAANFRRGFGILHLAENGALLIRHPEALNASGQELLARYLTALRDEPAFPLNVKILATADSAAVDDGRLNPELLALFGESRLEVPDLEQRKKDVLPLAELFLAKHDEDGGEPHLLAASARHRLLLTTYHHRNVDELREAIDFAALLAAGRQIGAEHIFTGPRPKDDPVEFDLSSIGLIDRLVRGGLLNWVRFGVLAFFAAIIACCLTAGDTVAGRIANAMTWGLWWPSLMVFFLFIGRVWCTVCPLASTSAAAKRIRCLNIPVPGWIKGHTGLLMGGLFVLIVWCEHVFEMPTTPLATGIFLLVLIGLATSFGVIFEREPWCRYVCPLGSLAASYSKSSMVYVRANPNVCASQCKTHACYKGADGEQGCPVFHHPLWAKDASNCKLCLRCLRICPNRSARMYVRPLAQNTWRQPDLSDSLVTFSMVVFYLSVVMLASEGGFATGLIPYTILTLASVGLALLTARWLPRLLHADESGDPALVSRVAAFLLILGWGGLMAFHLDNVPGFNAMLLTGTHDNWVFRLAGLTEIRLMPILQLSAIAFAALLGGLTLWRISIHTAANSPGSRHPWRWRIILGVGSVYTALCAAIILTKGIAA